MKKKRLHPVANAAHGRSGQAVIFVTLSLIPMFGLLGLVVDMGWANYRKEACRSAAQSAAYAAASAAQSSGTYTVQASTACPGEPDHEKPLDVGCQYAAQNGFTNGSNNRTVKMAGGTVSLGATVPQYWVTAYVSENDSTTFSRVLGKSAVTIAASATAGVFNNSGACVYVLDPTAQKAFKDTGGSMTIGCGIKVNSNASNAFNSTAHDAIYMSNGADISVHGQWDDSTSGDCCHFTGGGSVRQNQSSVSDPVSGLTPPTPSLPCTDIAYSSAQPPLNPGTYCKIDVSNTGGGTNALTLNPGTYIITGPNGFHLSGGIINANGVTIYFTGTSGGSMNVTGGTLNLTAPSDGGTMDGIAVWQNSADTTQGAISNGGHSTINGLIYMPSAHLDYTGGPSSAGNIVVDTLTVTGGNLSGPSSSKYFNNGYTASGVYLLPY